MHVEMTSDTAELAGADAERSRWRDLPPVTTGSAAAHRRRLGPTAKPRGERSCCDQGSIVNLPRMVGMRRRLGRAGDSWGQVCM